MCNRLGARKFLERYKETRADLAKKRRFEKDQHKRPLYNNYLPNILNEHGFVDDKLYCPWNNWSAANRRPARLYANERLSNIWLTCYSGKKKRIVRKHFYASLAARPTVDDGMVLSHKFEAEAKSLNKVDDFKFK